MSLSSATEVQRCRPLLGTFVEVRVTGFDDAALASAVEKAFAQIERIQSLMSVHDSASELSRVNAEAFYSPVRVGEETFEVLRRGLEIARDSDGGFDFTVAPILASWGLLPAHLCRRAQGNWRDVVLQRGNRVSFTRPLAIDLGGIAKGFAVDAAIASLHGSKVQSALVNAGGDLRAFGSRASLIHLRDPLPPHLLSHALELRDAALASSSPCFTECRWRRQTVSHLVNPRELRAVTGGISVTVRARECWVADALTKVVMNASPRAEHLLAKHDAEAFVFTA